MRHNPGYGIMADLMEGSPVPIDRFEIRLRRRHLYEISRRVIEGTCSTDAEIRAGRRDQRPGFRFDHFGRWRERRLCNIVWQTVTLVGVKDREARLRNEMVWALSPVSTARRRSSSGTKRSAWMTVVPRSPFRTLPPRARACRNVTQLYPVKPRSMRAPHRIRTLIPA